MRFWIVATTALAALAALLVLREASLSKQVKSLRHDNEQLIAQQRSLAERLEQAEEKFGQQQDQASSGNERISTFTVADHSPLSGRLTALEEQVRAIQAKLFPEYDPTVASAESEPETNAPPKRNWGPEQALGPPDTERDADSVTAWTSL